MMKKCLFLFWMVALMVTFPLLPALADSVNGANVSMLTATPTPTGPSLQGHLQVLDEKYTLSPGDIVNFSVYGTPEFDRNDLKVRPDGMVTVQPIGELQAAGKTVDEFAQLIQDRLKHYLKNPEVTLTVSKFHSAIVYVLGAVKKPGPYEIHGDMDQPDMQNALLSRGSLTVSNLIANAGGVVEDADVSHVLIRNNRLGKEQTVDLIRMLKTGDTSQDVVVGSGDTILVPEQVADLDPATASLLKKSALAPNMLNVRVMGKVDSPGVYAIDSHNSGINSAIASAKGYIIEANSHAVDILRADKTGKMVTIPVNPKLNDVPLKDNDVVLVDERSGPIVGRMWDYTNRVVTPFLSLTLLGNSYLDIIHPGRRYPNRTASPVKPVIVTTPATGTGN